jgi:thioredoxin reductase (NADPH)
MRNKESMTRPAIVIVAAFPQVLHTLKHDLEQHYSNRFRIIEADAGRQALNQLKQMSLHNEPVALLLADEQMPEMTGSALLKEARDLYPAAKRVLLITYADTHAAIQAISTACIDYYLMKPWDPPEERLYPPLDDVLADWLASYQPPLPTVRVIDHRWSPRRHAIGDFLARNQVPSAWLDVEKSKEATHLLEQLGLETRQLPVVTFPDGSYLVNPTLLQIAEKINLKTHAEKPFYDLIIVGSGPAGLAAGVYGASEGLRTLLVEQEAPGGQAGTSSRIENYLGFPAGVSGGELARRAVTQAERFGAEIITPQEAVRIKVDGQYRCVYLADGSELRCHTLLLACGVSYRRLDVPGIDALTGAGVYYGSSIAEAMSCSNEEVFIVGGANSAGQAAMYFANYARQVTMLVRDSSLAKDMSKYLIDQIEHAQNIEVKTCTRVVAVQGKSHLESITIANDKTHEEKTLPATSLFIFIGVEPHTSWLKGVVNGDEKGFILTGPDLVHEGQPPTGWPLDRDPFFLETSVPGIFAAGDVRHGSIKRVAPSVGEGAMAVQLIHWYLG